MEFLQSNYYQKDLTYVIRRGCQAMEKVYLSIGIHTVTSLPFEASRETTTSMDKERNQQSIPVVEGNMGINIKK